MSMKILALTLLLIPSVGMGMFKRGAKYIKALDKRCEVRVTSTFRTKRHNRRVGGVWNSLHLKDEAIDFVLNSNSSWCRGEAIRLAYKYDVAIIMYEKHVHVDSRKYKCWVKYEWGYRVCKVKIRAKAMDI